MMAPAQLVRVEPEELKFPSELKRYTSCSLEVVNVTDNPVAFKWRTTSPRNFCVRPNIGVVLPRCSRIVTVTMRPQHGARPETQGNDKFLLQSMLVPEGAASKDISHEMFNIGAGKKVFETKLRVSFVSPRQPPSPIPESADEGLSPRSFLAIDDAPQSGSAYEMGPKEIDTLKSQLTQTTITVGRQLTWIIKFLRKVSLAGPIRTTKTTVDSHRW